MNISKEINTLGKFLLSKNPEAAPRLRIIRDILGLPPSDPSLAEAAADLAAGRQVLELAETQKADGTWGRFHSQDTKIREKQQYITTEVAVNRALSIGLDKESVVLTKATGFMECVMDGSVTWSDPPEKHEGWPTGVRLITAATLAKIDRLHPSISGAWETWAEVLMKTFASGVYSSADERHAHQVLNGITTKNKYPKLAAIYPLLLLSATGNKLPKELETSYLDWVWHKKDGIYYLTWFGLDQFPELGAKEFPFWLEAIGLLTRFDYWASQHAEKIINFLWQCRNREGLWDFPAGAPSINGAKKCSVQISESWRNPVNREIDCSIRILSLIKVLYNVIRQTEVSIQASAKSGPAAERKKDYIGNNKSRS